MLRVKLGNHDIIKRHGGDGSIAKTRTIRATQRSFT